MSAKTATALVEALVVLLERERENLQEFVLAHSIGGYRCTLSLHERAVVKDYEEVIGQAEKALRDHAEASE